MRAKVFFAENNSGVKLSFTRLSLKKALENINKKNSDNEFTIIDYIITKKPKVVRDFIANSIFDKQIENTDLYDISDKEIKEIIEYSRDFFNTKISNNINEDYDSDNKDFEEYDSENDPEYIPSSNDEVNPDDEEEVPEAIQEEEAIPEEVIPQEESIIEKPPYVPKSKFFLVKEYFIIYGTAFILYNIFRYLKSNNYLSN